MSADRFTVTRAEAEPIGDSGRQDGYGAANIQYNNHGERGRFHLSKLLV